MLRHRVDGPVLIKKSNICWELSDYVNCVEPTETTNRSRLYDWVCGIYWPQMVKIAENKMHRSCGSGAGYL
jgi:hypothetical protein